MALAALDHRSLTILVWHHHDVDLPGERAAVELNVCGLPKEAASLCVNHYRIDADHSNAFSAWKRMGRRERPNSEQIAALKRAAILEEIERQNVPSVQKGAFSARFTLPRQAVSLICLSW